MSSLIQSIREWDKRLALAKANPSNDLVGNSEENHKAFQQLIDDDSEGEEEKIQSFGENLKQVLIAILDKEIRPNQQLHESEYGLYDPLPKFSGSIYISRVDQVQSIMKSVRGPSLLGNMNSVNRIRLKLLETEASPSTRYIDCKIIRQRLWLLLDETVRKCPLDQRIKRWWWANGEKSIYDSSSDQESNESNDRFEDW